MPSFLYARASQIECVLWFMFPVMKGMWMMEMLECARWSQRMQRMRQVAVRRASLHVTTAVPVAAPTTSTRTVWIRRRSVTASRSVQTRLTRATATLPAPTRSFASRASLHTSSRGDSLSRTRTWASAAFWRLIDVTVGRTASTVLTNAAVPHRPRRLLFVAFSLLPESLPLLLPHLIFLLASSMISAFLSFSFYSSYLL